MLPDVLTTFSLSLVGEECRIRTHPGTCSRIGREPESNLVGQRRWKCSSTRIVSQTRNGGEVVCSITQRFDQKVTHGHGRALERLNDPSVHIMPDALNGSV